MRKKLYNVLLSDADVCFLEEQAARSDLSATERKRCQILLKMDTAHGKENTIPECASTVGVGMTTVSNVVRLYIQEGLESAIQFKRNPNSDTSRQKMSSAEDEMIYKLLDSPPPEGHRKWTMRLLAEKSGEIIGKPVSKDTICRAIKRRK